MPSLPACTASAVNTPVMTLPSPYLYAPPPNMHAHAHAHVHAHACMHARMHARTCTRIRTRVRTHARAHACARARARRLSDARCEHKDGEHKDGEHKDGRAQGDDVVCSKRGRPLPALFRLFHPLLTLHVSFTLISPCTLSPHSPLSEAKTEALN